MIPVYRPYLPAQSLRYAHEALDSTWLSQGPYLQKATEKLQEVLQAKYLLLVNNGTSATHLMVKAYDYKYSQKPRRHIIIPNNVYVAAWNAFEFDRYHPKRRIYQVLDADVDTWNIDLSLLDRRISSEKYTDLAILIVHNLGNIINVPALKSKYPNFVFMEDNCEGFLGKYDNQYTGTASFAASISFFGNKNITCGEGGAVLCQDANVFEYLKCIHGQGQSNKKFVHNYLGYNYRMTNVQAAILYGQLEVLPEIIEKKQHIFHTYRQHFKDREDIKYQVSELETQHANWMFGIKIISDCNQYRIAEKFFADHGVEVRPMFYPMSAHSHLKKYANTHLENIAQELNKKCLILPSYPDLSHEEQQHVLSTVEEYLTWIKS